MTGAGAQATGAAAAGDRGVDPGRPGDLRPVLAGFDIGGTKIAAAVLGGGRILVRGTRPTPRTGGSDVLAEVLALLDGFRRSYPVVGVGVGAPGVVEPTTGSVASASDILPGWAGTPVGPALRSATGLPVAVLNDVRAMALGEARRGAGAGLARVLFASVGTGVGGAFVFGGVVQHGSHGTAGELAHLLVPGRGAIPCGCGRFDHLESVCAGPAIASEYARQAGSEPIGLPGVVARMRTGDPDARRVLTSAAQVLGHAVAGLASAVDVDAVVVGGGVAQIGDDFLDPLRAAFAESAIAPLRDTPVLAAALGTDAPLIGAAELISDALKGS